MKNKIIVGKILKYIDKLISYTDGVSYDNFIKNSLLIEACVFNLGQIGELANKIDKEFELNNNIIPWRTLYGLRNKIVHDYDGVNLTLIWDILESDLSDLKIKLENLYDEI